jgi:hypothetical protein
MPRDAIDVWAEQRPDAGDRRALERWLDAMPEIRSQTSKPAPSNELVYKTIERPAPTAEASPQMDPTTERAWNDWAESHVDVARREAQEITEILAEEVGTITGKLERRIHELEIQLAYEKRLHEFEIRLSKLTADLDADHARTAAPLIPLKGGRDAA